MCRIINAWVVLTHTHRCNAKNTVVIYRCYIFLAVCSSVLNKRWLTVSTTIEGMIGSFNSVLKSLVSYLLLPVLLGSFQAITVSAEWNVKTCCIGLLPPSWLLRFWMCDSNPLALFWVIYTYEWRFMPESSTCQYYPIKLGCSVAPEIALKCNINAAILGILPLWNTQGPSDAIATCYDQGDLSMSVMFHGGDCLCQLMKS